jgi:hypothetical protein
MKVDGVVAVRSEITLFQVLAWLLALFLFAYLGQYFEKRVGWWAMIPAYAVLLRIAVMAGASIITVLRDKVSGWRTRGRWHF